MAAWKQWVLAIVAAAGIYAGLQAWHQRTTDGAAIETQAATPTGNSDALAAQRGEQLARAGSPEAQAGIAAGQFLSFYFVNTRSRPAFCRAQGVDISPFVAQFAAGHQAEWERAQMLLHRSGLDPEMVWQQMQPSFDAIVQRGIGEGAGAARANPAGTCHLIAETPDVAVASLAWSKVNPQLDKILLDAK